MAKLKVAIKFTPDFDTKPNLKTHGDLSVWIKEALELPEVDFLRASVKIYLLPGRTSIGGKKTQLVSGTKSLFWDEVFKFKHVSFGDLKTKRVLEMTVWDYEKRGCHEFIGCLRLGPNPCNVPKPNEWMDSLENEVKFWEEMLSHPGEWVEYCLDLRPSIQNQSSSTLLQTVTPAPKTVLNQDSAVEVCVTNYSACIIANHQLLKLMITSNDNIDSISNHIN